MEAEGPLELIEKLELPGDDPFSDYRMWIKILTPSGREAWQDVCISSLSEGIYREALKLCENKTEINAVIRGQKENSPQSSPRGETGDRPSTPAKPPPSIPNDHELQTTLSSLTESTSEYSIGPSTQPISIRKFIPLAKNKSEPFLLLDFSDPDLELIPLFFAIKKKSKIMGFDILLVDKSSLEFHVQTQTEKGRKLTNISIGAMCHDGVSRSFQLSLQVWIGSVLEHSKCLRRIFSKGVTVEVARKEQLAELKELDLFLNVQYWIADLFEVELAEQRLSSTSESPGVAKQLSSYYFSVHEAKYLGNFYASGDGKTLKDFLNKLGEEDNVCTSHNLALKLLNIFDIPTKFREDASFQKKRNVWMKAQGTI